MTNLKERAMPAYNVAEAKAKLSTLLKKAQRGEEVVIAKDHKPVAKLVPFAQPPAGRRKPGSGKDDVLYVAPDAFQPLDELPIREIREWLPYMMYTDAELRKLRRANPDRTPKQVLKYR
jgi:prevent-host-death family protein